MADGSSRDAGGVELLGLAVADLRRLRATVGLKVARERIRKAVFDGPHPLEPGDPRCKLAEALLNSGDEAAEGVARVFVHVFDVARHLVFRARRGEITPHEVDRSVEGLIAIGRRVEFWERPLEDWRAGPDGRLALYQLARHLFVKWEMPDFMDGAWQSGSSEALRDWYVRIGRGGAVLPVPGEPDMTSRQAHFLMTAPVECMLPNGMGRAVLRGQVLAMGGSPVLASTLCRLALGRAQLLAPEQRPFWQTVFRFFIDNPGLTPAQIELAVTFFNARRTEEGAGAMERAIPRWTHRTLVQHMRVWDKVNNPPDTRPFKLSGRKTFRSGVWSLSEIADARELNIEGEQMRHCVGGYALKSVTGLSSFWSLRCTDGAARARRRLTVELDHTGTIIMARGRLNRWPMPEEMAVLGRWADAEGLKLGRDFQAHVLLNSPASVRQ